MRLIIAGSRDWTDYALLCKRLELFVSTYGMPSVVISGGAKGADALGEKWAAAKGVKLHRVIANWQRYDKAAGHVRNGEMAAVADACALFWDGSSPGSADMRRWARQTGLILFETRRSPSI